MAPSDVEKHHSRAIEEAENLSLDDAVLKAQGHRPELDRSFSWVGILGVSYTVALSWAGFMCAVLSIGQYHFTYILSPRRIKDMAAFTVGIFNIMAWWTGTASAMLYIALSIFGTVKFWVPGFDPLQWQTYLLYALVTLTSMLPVFLVPHRYYDSLTTTCLGITIVACVVVIVVPLAMGVGHFDASNLVTFRGVSGWSPGTAWLLSISNSAYAFAAVGSVTHLAEEMPRPGKNLPLVINTAMGMGILTTLPVSIVIVGTLTDMAAVQQAYLPSLEAFYQATGSKAAGTVLQVLLTASIYASFPGLWVTNGRVAWAFSRDNGLPCSPYFSKVSSRFHFPVRATFLGAVFIIVYGVVYIASTQAFNAIVNTCTLLLNLTFTIPQVIILFGRRKHLPPRHFDLGRYGGSAVIGAFLVLSVLVWIERRGRFSGPQIDWERLGGLNKQE
ncbi:hypothetical protein FE257_002652 [Aspergillus nanangensis]|uniref:Uncharacterized protein n=1 Tax=Aspergillus nanangensis TaxID=2582783 RepID=A0AAD4CCF9_ASPNN|nr:hypothetical protein FE257_002652 [Aspergillus nanangensis]